MNICKDCKWWEQYDKVEKGEWGDCLKLMEYLDPYWESSPEFFESTHVDGYNTPQDFGCIHWEKKDE